MAHFGIPGPAKKTRDAKTRRPLTSYFTKLGRSGSKFNEKAVPSDCLATRKPLAYCKTSADDGGSPPPSIQPLQYAGKQTDRPKVALATRRKAFGYQSPEKSSRYQSEWLRYNSLASTVDQKLGRLSRPELQSTSMNGSVKAKTPERDQQSNEIHLNHRSKSRQILPHNEKGNFPNQENPAKIFYEGRYNDFDTLQLMTDSTVEVVGATGAQFLGSAPASTEDLSADEITLDYYSIVGDIAIHDEDLQDLIDAHGEYIENRVVGTLLEPGYKPAESLDDVVLQFQHEKDRFETALKHAVHGATHLQGQLLTKNVELDGEALGIITRYSGPREKVLPLLQYEILLGDSKDTRERINFWLLGHLRESSEQISARRRCLPADRIWSKDEITWSFLVWNSWSLDDAARGPPLTPAYQETVSGASVDIVSVGFFKLNVHHGPSFHESVLNMHPTNERPGNFGTRTRSI